MNKKNELSDTAKQAAKKRIGGTRTVRLDDNYRVATDGNVEFFTRTRDEEYDYEAEKITREAEWGYVPTQYKIGAEVVLLSHTDVSPNALRSDKNVDRYSLSFSTEGIGGNSNPEIKRLHGWRGTTQDISCYAHGLRKITKIRTLKNGMIAITVSHDLTPDEA